MKIMDRRLRRLEDPWGSANRRPQRCLRLVVSKAGWGLALDKDRCLQILEECGFLPTPGVANLGAIPAGVSIGLVDFLHIPEGLNAEELERFLREHGEDLCSPRGAQMMGDQPAPASTRLYERGFQQ